MRKWSLFALVAAAIAAALVAGACASKPTPTPAPTPTPTLSPAQSTATATLQIKVDLSNYAFSPSTIVVPQGRPVQITLHSNQGQHTFTIDSLHVDVPVDTSSDVVKTIRVDVPGNYVFYSSTDADKTRNMAGNLVVLPQ